MSEKRKESIDWYLSLTYEEQFLHIIKNKDDIAFYPDRTPDSLTGREIEDMYSRMNRKENFIKYFNSHPSIEELFQIPSGLMFTSHKNAKDHCDLYNLDPTEIQIIFKEEII